MSKKPKPDFTQVAFRVGQRAAHLDTPTEDPAPDTPRVAASRKGGLKGGKARAAKMTPEERSASAKRAAEARWKEKP